MDAFNKLSLVKSEFLRPKTSVLGSQLFNFSLKGCNLGLLSFACVIPSFCYAFPEIYCLFSLLELSIGDSVSILEFLVQLP